MLAGLLNDRKGPRSCRQFVEVRSAATREKGTKYSGRLHRFLVTKADLHCGEAGDLTRFKGTKGSESINSYLEQLQNLHTATNRRLASRRRRQDLILLLQRKYGLKLHGFEHLSASALVQLAVSKRAIILAKAAAHQMVSWFHLQQLKKALMMQEVTAHSAARKIQRQWKRYCIHTLYPRQIADKREHAALIIQKWVRGHLDRIRVRKWKVLRDINRLHFHFERVRYNALAAKVPLIVKSWRTYRQRKKRVVKECDVFHSSITAPPMRANIQRPQPLLVSKRAVPRRPDRVNTENSEQKSPEPHTAPLPAVFPRRATRHLTRPPDRHLPM